jgi:hypothetical protein
MVEKCAAACLGRLKQEKPLFTAKEMMNQRLKVA